MCVHSKSNTEQSDDPSNDESNDKAVIGATAASTRRSGFVVTSFVMSGAAIVVATVCAGACVYIYGGRGQKCG